MARAQPLPVVNNRFAAALQQFGAALLETSAVTHTGTKGTKREDALRAFIKERLPTRYGVATGEVVDQFNTSSPQLDVLVFDQTRNFSFSDGDGHVLPAEALIASIEVKSKLNAKEVEKSCIAARKLRALRPFKRGLAGRDIGSSAVQPNGPARYLHCIFGYDTDLSENTWIKHEAARFRQYQKGDEHLIDWVYVLKRGVLNMNGNSGRLEDETGSAITKFYFTLLNFIEREGRRRSDTPYQEYASLLGANGYPLAADYCYWLVVPRHISLVGFMMVPPSKMIFQGWRSDFRSGKEKFFGFVNTCH